VRVDPLVLKCVGFFGAATNEDSLAFDFEPFGTGFLVSIRSSTAGRVFHCFVTARHSVKDLNGAPPLIALNAHDGRRHVYRIDGKPKWWFHPTDKTADVAVLPYSVEPRDDIVSLGEELFLTDKNREKYKIGAGDEVFIVGLFSRATGSERNIPIVRHGNIAMLPDEPIQTDSGYEDVYLIEARSIGGLSGSPVFVRETVQLQAKSATGEPMVLAGLGRLQLLGLCVGHWDVKESDLNRPHPSGARDGGGGVKHGHRPRDAGNQDS